MAWIKLTDLPGQKLVNTTFANIVYWEVENGKVVHQKRPKRNADVESFELLEGSDFIARDKNSVYHAWSTLKSVDRDTFEVLGNGYFSDKNLAYFEHEASLKPLKGQTVEGFKALGNSYARDVKFGYYCGRVIAKCTSPMTLQPVTQSGPHPIFVVFDENQVYYEGALLKKADPKTWKIVDRGFSADANSIYFGADKLGSATPENWRLLKYPYSTNGKKIYHMGFALAGADLDSFEVLPGGSCRDKISAFVGRKRA